MIRVGEHVHRGHDGGCGEVSVWFANLDDLPDRPDGLSRDDLARSKRFRTSQLRDRCWVRKEAYAKVDGMGIDRHLADVTITGFHTPQHSDPLGISEIAADDSLVAALAVPAARRIVYRGRWLGEEAA